MVDAYTIVTEGDQECFVALPPHALVVAVLRENGAINARRVSQAFRKAAKAGE